MAAQLSLATSSLIRAGDSGVADVGVDLDEELPPDDHRLGLRVVDVGWDDRPAGGDFASDKFDIVLLAQRDEAHLRGDDTSACVVHLRHPFAGLRPPRCGHPALPLLGGPAAAHSRPAVIGELPATARVLFGVPTGGDPLRPPWCQSLLGHAAGPHRPVDLDRGIGPLAGRVVEMDLSDGHADAVRGILNPPDAVLGVLLGVRLGSCGLGGVRVLRDECRQRCPSLPTPALTGSGSAVPDAVSGLSLAVRLPRGQLNLYHTRSERRSCRSPGVHLPGVE